jgi:putative endonuclease
MLNSQQLGQRGETLAAAYLQRQGYQILAKNYRTGHLEIDLVVSRSGQLVCVEVKTRRQTAASQQDNPLSPGQIRHLKRAMSAYCRHRQLSADNVRLDLIVILVKELTGSAELQHYRDIF